MDMDKFFDSLDDNKLPNLNELNSKPVNKKTTNPVSSVNKQTIKPVVSKPAIKATNRKLPKITPATNHSKSLDIDDVINGLTPDKNATKSTAADKSTKSTADKVNNTAPAKIDLFPGLHSNIVAKSTENPDKTRVYHAKDIHRQQGATNKTNTLFTKKAVLTRKEQEALKSLGLSDCVDYKVKRKPLTTGLSLRDRQQLYKDGHYASVNRFAGRRFDVQNGYKATLDFLARFKFANLKTLNHIFGDENGDPYITKTINRLKRMSKSGLIVDYDVLGQVGGIWALTPKGMAMTGYDLKPYNPYASQQSSMTAVFGVNYLASCLYKNSFNVLYLDDFPAYNRTMVGQSGNTWTSRGEDLVSEYQLRSSFFRNILDNGQMGIQRAGSQDEVVQQAKLIWHEWERDRTQPSPEMAIDNEYLWILFPEGALTASYHVPDLVVKRPRINGMPESIAVESELHKKSADNYERTMRAYKEDISNHRVYKKVIWVIKSNAIARAIEQAADNVGCPKSMYDIVPFTTREGLFKGKDISRI